MNFVSRTRMGWAGLVLAAALTGCANQPQQIYGWGHYQDSLYTWFKGENLDEQKQIDLLQADLQQMQGKGKACPPGLHAQLGLLYAHQGKSDEVVREFATEKQLYPESAAYMDFLLRNFKQQQQVAKK
ncbi:DUF4810 domain-containing protein [Silvimonas amylolytica]|uniref:DUF4810 domain-containing protein n=1 Tax=Silvimonas amylolytica TaxID=449663 RepID=A0ABQ2PMB1_9NEIS|nr:DUF4810 domain-containing protein [Silvimonas amylolytica]GGP26612.1 DUF4810 domain-containing protein [Silvimonas amylolytica]